MSYAEEEAVKTVNPEEVYYGMPSDYANVVELALHKMREWLKDIYPGSKIDRAIVVYDKWKEFEGANGKEYRGKHMRVKIFTSVNEYTIQVRFARPEEVKKEGVRYHLEASYMGLVVESRKKRPGEFWHRGNDLPDGNFTDETWWSMMKGIIRYEAQEIQSQEWKMVGSKEIDVNQCIVEMKKIGEE